MKATLPASLSVSFFFAIDNTTGSERPLICHDFLDSLGIPHGNKINVIIYDYQVLGAWEVSNISPPQKMKNATIINECGDKSETYITMFLYELLEKTNGRAFVLIEPEPTTTKTLTVTPANEGDKIEIKTPSLAAAFEELTKIIGFDDHEEMKKCYISLWKTGRYERSTDWGNNALFLWE